MDYSELKDEARVLIAEFGTEVQLVRRGSSDDWTKGFDPATGSVHWDSEEGERTHSPPAETDETYDGQAVLTQWPKQLIREGLIEVDDVRVVLACEEEVAYGDEIVLATGRSFRVVPPVDRAAPDGHTVIVQIVNGRAFDDG